MTSQTFIFVHDQQIVLDYKAAGKFAELPDVKYVFLGQRPTDLIRDLPDVVIARELPFNIEHLPNLVAWTGWFAVVKNGLVTADIVNLFEYDVNVLHWEQPKIQTAYFWHPYADETWWNYNGIRSELRRMKVSVADGYLPMTSNYTLKKDRLEVFIDNLMRSSQIDAEHPQAGHIIERYCSSMWQYEVSMGGGLKHFYADSHGTQGRGSDYERMKPYLL